MTCFLEIEPLRLHTEPAKERKGVKGGEKVFRV